MRGAHRVLALGLGLLAAGVAGLAVLAALGSGLPAASGAGDARVREGALIFRAGVDADGRPVPYRGGMPQRMSCAQCHGADGKGRRHAMFVAPDITYRNLTDPAGMLEPSGERGHRFTDEQIKRAITDGVDPEGKPLAWPMPRWQLTPQQLDSLLAYLKTLP